MSLKDKVVLLTGAVGGIGSSTARRLARDGARLALLDRDAEKLQRLRAELGTECQDFVCDVADESSMAEAVRAVSKRFDCIDVGVLNAGVSGKRGPLQDIELEAFEHILSVNARGVFLGLKHLFAPLKSAGGGSVVVMGSTESLRGNAGLAAYVASKHAVLGLVRTAALEWAKHNIRVNCVNPGPVDTDMMRAVERGMIEAGDHGVRERNTSRIPLSRYAAADDVANVIAFLAGDESAYSTGGTYLVDGGILAGKLD